MSIIEAASVGVRTMADGTLRLSVDIEPRFARDAFVLFGSPGTPMALAALIASQPEPSQQNEIKGGELARLAGMLCGNPAFQSWLKVKDSDEARQRIIETCGIRSRAELDHNEVAARVFHREFRIPFSTAKDSA